MTPRPRLHLTAARNWLNDPVGPFQLDGVHHLFHQANPDGLAWGPPRWGHLTSRDLVHWERRPDALVPDGTGADADGCWSGCVRVVDGAPLLFYTGVVGTGDADRVEAVCVATTDDLVTWTRRDPPLVPGPPDALGPGPHRDPFLVRTGAGWRLLLGSDRGGSGPGGTVLSYVTDDPDPTARTWRYEGVFLHRPDGSPVADAIHTGPLWECPQLLHVDGRDVLLVSVSDPPLASGRLQAVVWFLGAVRDGRFDVAHMGLLDHGEVFYAPTVMRDESGRPVLWGWLQELGELAEGTSDHAGALSLPRTLTVVGDRVVTQPVEELAVLRAGPATTGAVDGAATTLALAAPHALVDVGPVPAAGCTVELRGPDDALLLAVEVPRPGAPATVRRTAPALTRTCPPGDGTGLELVVDGAVVQVRHGEGWCTTRVTGTVASVHAAGPPAPTLTAHALPVAVGDDAPPR